MTIEFDIPTSTIIPTASRTLLWSYDLNITDVVKGSAKNANVTYDYTLKGLKDTQFFNNTIEKADSKSTSGGITQCTYSKDVPTNFVATFAANTMHASVSLYVYAEIVDANYEINVTESIMNPVYNLLLPILDKNHTSVKLVVKTDKTSFTKLQYSAFNGDDTCNTTKKETHDVASDASSEIDVTAYAKNTTEAMIGIELTGTLGSGHYLFIAAEYGKASKSGSSSNTGMIVGITIAVVAVLGIAGYCFWQRRQRSGYEPLLGDAK